MDTLTMNTEEAARLLGVHVTTLTKMRCVGNGPKYIRLGYRTIRYRVSDLEAFIASRVMESTSQQVAA